MFAPLLFSTGAVLEVSSQFFWPGWNARGSIESPNAVPASGKLAAVMFVLIH
jgi:hypothetical protein